MDLSHVFALDVYSESQQHSGCQCRTASPAAFAGAEAEDHYPRDLGLSTKHLEIYIRVNIEKKSIAVNLVHHIIANREGERELVLDGVGFHDLMVEGVDESQGKVSYSYDSKKIIVDWADVFVKDETRKIRLSYEVVDPPTGLFFMSPTSEDVSRPTYAATDHETERARYWLACIDSPNVKSTLDWHITASDQWFILANGAFVHETNLGNGEKTVFWQLKQPCPSYLACFVVGDMVQATHGRVGEIPIESFATREFTSHHLDLSFGRTPKMLEWMIGKLGVAFPYPKYFQFALPNFGGAMENISLVSWDDQFVCTEKSFHEQSWLTDQVNVHEMAHSYFGDLVGCRDFSHVWLKESWATYMETCWLEDQKGKDEQLYDLWRNGGGYFDEADQKYMRPLVTRRYQSSWQMFDMHLYQGGACRLHTLRCELGDRVFWQAVQDYLQKFQNSVVETNDFRSVLEQHSGRSLQKFFDQWFFGAGYPDLKVAFSYDKKQKKGTFEVTQKQVSKGGTVFELKTNLGWTFNKGKGELENLVAIVLDNERQSFSFAMDQEPAQVRFDPLCKVLHKLEFDPGEAMSLEQLQNSTDVVGRIQAAQNLGKTGKNKNLESLADRYKTESFWGVKREIIKVLADSQTEKSIEILLGFMETESDHLVLDRLMSALGQFRDERVKKALSDYLQKSHLPPKAWTQAVQALGNQRDPKLIPQIKEEFLKDESPQKAVARASLQALGATRSPDVLPYLKEQIKPQVLGYRIRKGAVLGLSQLAPYVDRFLVTAIEENVADLLRDQDKWVREAAVQGIGIGRMTSALKRVKNYGARLPLQDKLGVDKVVEHLSAEDPGGRQGALEKQLEELKASYRKLEARIQDLEDKKSAEV